MAGDLEDFLRRAAERRKAKAAQQQQPQQQKRQAPPARRQQAEYADRRSERMVRPIVEPEEVLVAEVVEDPFAEKRRRLEEAKQAAAKAQAEAAKKSRGIQPVASRSSGAAPALTGDVAGDLLKMLKHPGGIRQAILLREILDRPEHRW